MYLCLPGRLFRRPVSRSLGKGWSFSEDPRLVAESKGLSLSAFVCGRSISPVKKRFPQKFTLLLFVQKVSDVDDVPAIGAGSFQTGPGSPHFCFTDVTDHCLKLRAVLDKPTDLSVHPVPPIVNIGGVDPDQTDGGQESDQM